MCISTGAIENIKHEEMVRWLKPKYASYKEDENGRRRGYMQLTACNNLQKTCQRHSNTFSYNI
jgi:hypothetical protein